MMSKTLLLLAMLSGAVAIRTETEDDDLHELNHEEEEEAEGSKHCCCKSAKCEEGSTSKEDNSPAVYNPQLNLCCKHKKRSCGHPFQAPFTAYTTTAPNPRFCSDARAGQTRFSVTSTSSGGENVEQPVDMKEAKPGSPEHTVHTYCDMNQITDARDTDEDTEPSQSTKEKNGIVKALVNELSKNSMDSMAKEIFSLYVCVRWAPSVDFIRTANGEIATGQLDNKSTAMEHYAAHHFMPLRCSKNVNVYGDSPVLGETHFQTFEAEMQAVAEWFNSEADNTLAKRLEKLQESKGADLDSAAKAFDLDAVRKVASTCQSDKPILVNVQEATSEQLLQDCAATKWWLERLENWTMAMPFTSFMMPDKEAAKQVALQKEEQAIVCFGKRVASQLHRREEGGHLMTDQSMVGCHGFWELPVAGKMLERIVQLWRPPTCQLAAMELDMKMKIMDLIAHMNAQLFDALPAMLVDEMSTVPDYDGKALQASHGVGIMRGVFGSIAKSFNGLKGQYVRLGQLLGNTVVKWVVCPLKPIKDPDEADKLDMALGTEDDLAQYYAKAAYSKWTGEEDLLPGQSCTREDAESKLIGLPRTQLCSLGFMQEDMPEPYKDPLTQVNEEFLCPIRPLLPAKQQLNIFKERRSQCLLHMSMPQMLKSSWLYRGRTPQRKQYNVTENLPTPQYQAMKVLDIHSRPDSQFAIWRDFVNVGHGCTEEEKTFTPRWCKKLVVLNEPSLVSNTVGAVVGAAATGGSAVAGLVRAGLEAGGVVEESKVPSNKATSERLGSWLYGKAKGVEKWVKNSTDEWFGRASGRYERLHNRLFDEVEASELLHSASFQSALPKTGGDSKNRAKFDRYAVLAPCPDFDPNREFKLKYTWSENALDLARKAVQKFGSGLMTKAGAFTVQLRGSGVLFMRDESNAWMSYAAHVRAASAGSPPSAWKKTSNPSLQELSGVLNTGSDSKVSASSVLGFEVVFTCGTRVDMHNLDYDTNNLSRAAKEYSKGDFAECVKDGKESNKNLRETKPEQPFLKDEVVVRAMFAPLENCYKDTDAQLVNRPNETLNPVYNNFAGISGCAPVNLNEGQPEDLKLKSKEPNFRGILLGKGVPENTLQEVLLDPEDFLVETSAAGK